jgi:hypothetical protein
MNERIKQLAEQASCDIKDKFGNWIGQKNSDKKFW